MIKMKKYPMFYAGKESCKRHFSFIYIDNFFAKSFFNLRFLKPNILIRLGSIIIFRNINIKF